MAKTQPAKVCFQVDQITQERIEALPRGFNLSEKLRIVLNDVLDGINE